MLSNVSVLKWLNYIRRISKSLLEFLEETFVLDVLYNPSTVLECSLKDDKRWVPEQFSMAITFFRG